MRLDAACHTLSMEIVNNTSRGRGTFIKVGGVLKGVRIAGNDVVADTFIEADGIAGGEIVGNRFNGSGDLQSPAAETKSASPRLKQRLLEGVAVNALWQAMLALAR